VCSEKTANLVEDLLKIILNNPLCYSDKILEFFRKHAVFSVFPSVHKYFNELNMEQVTPKSKSAHKSVRNTNLDIVA
jgi:hypothetical protein